MRHSQANAQEIPSQFLDRMKGLLGDEYSAFFASLQLPPVTGLRVNNLKLHPTEFAIRSPWQLAPVSWCPSGYVIDPGQINLAFTSPGKHPYQAAGLYYLQDPAAMAAAEFLSPQPGEKVLDLAAAPGGKATHLAALMNNTGLLVTNEIHIERYWDLAENLQRCGVTNSIGTIGTPEKIALHFGEYFDRVLLDAPCSGEGMFRKGNIARREWKPELIRGCAQRQSNILEQASCLLKPGGSLVYSTCTFSPEENEAVIASFLASHPEYSIETIHTPAGSDPARPDWAGYALEHPVRRAIRIWPHRAQGEGHFLALLVKNDSLIKPRTISKQKTECPVKKFSLSRLDKSIHIAFDNFCQENLSISFDASRLAQVGTFVYFIPDPIPDLSAINVLNFGWFLGHVQKGRFLPSHHLAKGITQNQAYHSISMAPEDQRLSAYLRGETIPDTGEETWVLICVDNFPVGWAKRVQQVLKNYYPRGLRRNS